MIINSFEALITSIIFRYRQADKRKSLRLNNNILHNFHGKNIKIGIVDTGINNSIVPNIINSFKGDYPDYNDYVGHGTKVASIINSLTHSTILYNIKIFDKESNSTAQKGS